MIIEIINPSGTVSYRRPAGHPDIAEAEKTIGYTTRKMSRGGKRKGAGRPARETPLEAITVRIEPEHAEKFRKLCKANGLSQAKQITEWIIKHPDTGERPQ